MQKKISADVLSNVSMPLNNISLNEKLPGVQGNCLYLACDICNDFFLHNLTQELTRGMNTVKLLYKKGGMATRRTVGSAEKKPPKQVDFVVLRF